ncbi:hypothetical protein JCM10213_006468 [Rhodosporidiobolus nylandii]
MLETGTSRRHGEEDEEVAYRLQVLGAREGAIKWSLIAGTAMIAANYRFPFVARQTLAGKAFVVSWFTIFGRYLLGWEASHRAESEKWRELARRDIAARGSIPTETAMRAWKAENDARLAANAAPPIATSPSPVTPPPEAQSKVLKELQAGKVAKETA